MPTDENLVNNFFSRRSFLKGAAGGAVATSATAGCLGIGALEGGSETATATDRVRFALSTAGSGVYKNVGREERRGFDLAIKHINEGGGLVDEGVFVGLEGEGVLGRSVENTTYQYEGGAGQPREKLEKRLSDGDLAMFCGGVSGAVVQTHRSLATEHDVPYMAGSSLLTSLSGDDCAATVYREQFPSDAVLKALGPVLEAEFGEAASYQQLYVDTVEGNDLVDSVSDYFTSEEAPDWETAGTIRIRKGKKNMDRAFESIRDTDPDVVFCNLFGLDATNFIHGADEKLTEGTGVVVPWINQSIAGVVQESIAGVLGTTTWDPGFSSWRSKRFAKAYRDAYSQSSSQMAPGATGPAHLVYGQTLSFAAAAERAGSFDSEAIRDELEGLSYNLGLGDETMQACNHQATRPVPVVRGRAEQTEDDSWFDVETLSTDAVTTCEETAASDCSF